MTREEAIHDLRNLDDWDQEIAHGYADDILLHLLESFGESEVAQAYRDARERIGFWYA